MNLHETRGRKRKYDLSVLKKVGNTVFIKGISTANAISITKSYRAKNGWNLFHAKYTHNGNDGVIIKRLK